MSSQNSFWNLTITVNVEEKSQTRTHTWNVLIFIDVHTELIDYISLKINIKYRNLMWSTHLVFKPEISEPEWHTGC